MQYRITSSVGPGVVVVVIVALLLGLTGFVVAIVAEAYGIAFFCAVVGLFGSRAAGQVLAYRAHEREVVERIIGS